MKGILKAKIRRLVACAVCVLLLVLLLASPSAWAQKGEKPADAPVSEPVAGQDHGQANPDQKDITPTGGTDDTKDATPNTHPDSTATTPDASHEGAPSNTTPSPVLQASEFSYPITVGSDTKVACTFTVIDENRHFVQIGNGTDPAIRTDRATGDMTLPSTLNHAGVTYTLTRIGAFAFKGCTKITSTGLAGNDTIVSIGKAAFNSCTGLETTGLEANSKVTSLEDAESNHDEEQGVFAQCTSLTSSGLTANHTLELIGEGAFCSCSLGTGVSGTGDNATNSGDLVLNEPANGEKLDVGNYAFIHNSYTELYLIGDKDCIGLQSTALSGVSIGTVYVPASWDGTEVWGNGTGDETKSYTVDAGTLVIMDPVKDTRMTAKRSAGTAGEAKVTFNTKASFLTTITDGSSVDHGPYSIIGGGKVKKDVDVDIPKAPFGEKKLTPYKQTLTASTSAVYPLQATPRMYNTAKGAMLQCDLDSVVYTIKYMPNGADGEPYEQSIHFGMRDSLGPCTFARKGYKFAKWTENADGSGKSYADKEALQEDLKTLQDDEATLYAQWKEVPTLNVRVSSIFPNQGKGATPLANAGYILSTKDSSEDPSAYVYGITTGGEGGTDPVNTWPQMSDKEGLLYLNGIPYDSDEQSTTYYLFNTFASSGYQLATNRVKIAIDSEGKVSVDGGASYAPEDKTVHIEFTYAKTPDLPTTGTVSSALVQGLGGIIILAIIGTIVRKTRRRHPER